MYIIKTVEQLQDYIKVVKEEGKSIGFAPTMGALHEGHLSLIKHSLKDGHHTICSIFVNPTQFDDQTDLQKYPKPIERDIELLIQAGCDVLFLPTVEEIYPKDISTPNFDLGNLDKHMEGAERPGHFQGVVQVVHRLLEITTPDALYMGQKDYQQFAVIKRMLQLMNSSIRLVRVPIKREADGLAMSSRNIRLSETGRQQAAGISALLRQAAEDAKSKPLDEVKAIAVNKLEQKQLQYDYLSFIDGDSLEEVDSFDDATTVTACIVVRIDNVRLLDNIILKDTK